MAHVTKQHSKRKNKFCCLLFNTFQTFCTQQLCSFPAYLKKFSVINVIQRGIKRCSLHHVLDNDMEEWVRGII
jgi:hypothetical protein